MRGASLPRWSTSSPPDGPHADGSSARMTRLAPAAHTLARMKTPLCLALVAAVALPVAMPATAPAAKKKRKECEFTKKKAKRKKARLCADVMGQSRWVVVSGNWKEKLTIHDADPGGATFDG